VSLHVGSSTKFCIPLCGSTLLRPSADTQRSTASNLPKGVAGLLFQSVTRPRVGGHGWVDRSGAARTCVWSLLSRSATRGR